MVRGKDFDLGSALLFSKVRDVTAWAPLLPGKLAASPTTEPRSINESILRVIVICPLRSQMMVTPVFFGIGVQCQSDPTKDRKEQANTCGCQAEEDADPECERHTQKHPKETCL